MNKKIQSILEIKPGSKIICPESTMDLCTVVNERTNFSINREGFWMVDCSVCGESHIIDYLFIRR